MDGTANLISNQIDMARLKLFTSKNCPKCPAAKEIISKVAAELGMNPGREYEILSIDEEDNLISALKYQIASTPSIVIDGEAAFIGVVPKRDDLIKRLRV